METNNKNELIPIFSTHPGEILKEELAERNIKQKDFAKEIGMQPSHLNALIHGKRSVSKDLAIRLEQVLGIPFTSWMKLQSQYDYDIIKIAERDKDENEAAAKEKKFNEIINLKEIYRRLNISDALSSQRVHKLINLMRNYNPSDDIEFIGLYKRSDKLIIDQRNMRTWSLLVYINAMNAKGISNFTEESVERSATKISEHANSVNLTIDGIKNILEKAGIIYIEIPKMEKTPIDAFSAWIGNNPVIAVTYRYNDMDKLSFDILHELGHIKLHLKKGDKKAFVKIDNEYSTSKIEKEADKFAQDKLIPPHIWRKIQCAESQSLIPSVVAESIAKSAENNNISPSVAVARYKHESDCYAIRRFRSPKIWNN